MRSTLRREAAAAPVPPVTTFGHDFWHGSPQADIRSIATVEEPAAQQRLGLVIGLAAIAVVGLSTVVGAGAGAVAMTAVVAGVWWTAYALYAVAFWLADRRFVRGVPVEQAAVLAQVVLGVVIVVLQAGSGLAALALVVSAVSASYVWSASVVAAVIAGQTLAVAVGAALADVPGPTIGLLVVAYGCFQAFAALVVLGERRESAAREELAIAHAELRAATAMLESSARNAERLRISRELHDELGHQLTALALELEVAGHHVDGFGAQHVARARTIAKDLLQGVRQTVGRLREERELRPTLEALVTGLPGLDVDLRVHEEVPVDGERSFAVVRCVQEILTNALRHAGAEHVTVEVVSDDAGLRLVTVDDGRGVEQVTPGHGLEGIRERFAELGGSVEFTSERGRGFRVEGQVPAR